MATLAIAAGEALPGGVRTATKIDLGHKVAIRRIRAGDPVVKYAQAIGRATSDIEAGEHVHSHNLSFDQDRLAISPQGAPEEASAGPAEAQRRLLLSGPPGSDLGNALADLRAGLPPGYRLDEG